MKIFKRLIVFTILLITFLLWILFLRYELAGKLFNISEWGGYLLVVPLVGSIILVVNRQLTNKLIMGITLTAVLPVVLDKNFDITLFCLKISMIVAGALATNRVLSAGIFVRL
ncbi:MAG: hypothetical protein FWE30_02365 [Bacteroidales bacterium]|nr:hypothetical protein [Bacteroidales bacterium]